MAVFFEPVGLDQPGPETAGTTVVEDVYNGLGQLVDEYQSHSGTVSIGTTPVIQYGYTDMSGGQNNSRPTSITYANGRVISYNYNPGLDSTISRLSSLSDNSATLEAYTYLGLGTVVQRLHPQTGINLSYISPTGAAGDKYTGLDAFGRIVEQAWENATGSTKTDDFLYTYDRCRCREQSRPNNTWRISGYSSASDSGAPNAQARPNLTVAGRVIAFRDGPSHNRASIPPRNTTHD